MALRNNMNNLPRHLPMLAAFGWLAALIMWPDFMLRVAAGLLLVTFFVFAAIWYFVGAEEGS